MITQTHSALRVGLLTIGLVCVVRDAQAASWTRQAADAGMTKYTPDTIAANGKPQLTYKKRFYGTWGGYTGNYFYGGNLVIQKGQAVLFSNDVNDGTLQATKFDWGTGAPIAHYKQPYQDQYGPSQNDREADSHHFTNPVIWHSDGRIYSRRGGDNNAMYALDPQGGTWTPIGRVAPPGMNGFSGDANAFLQTYGDELIYRYGATFDNGPYASYDISAAAFQNGTLGAYIASLGPTGPNDPLGYTYGDVPKVARHISVVASLVSNSLVHLEAVDILTGERKWQKDVASDSGGNQGFYTSVSDYWRFLATEDGQFVFFSRPGGTSCVLHVLDLATGDEKWTRTLASPSDRPLLAYHAGALYVIGRTQQLKLNINDNTVMWQANGNFPNDTGYIHHNYDYGTNLTDDPVYRPVVLTDDTVWFVNGSFPGTGVLVGLKTADGSIAKTIDLAALTQSGTESLELVNDLVASDGQLGILLDITDSADSHTPKNRYQDLYVYTFPPPTSPELSVSSASLTFSAGAGDTNPPAQTVSVINAGIGILNWSATKTASWLTVSPAQSGNGPTTVTVSVDITGLAAGVYVDTITITDPKSIPALQTVSVTLKVSPPSAQYDDSLKVPVCAVPSPGCSSGALLNGRGLMSNGNEVHQPNTLHDACPDGASGSYHSDESIDALQVSTLDGTTMTPGKQVKVDATVWVYAGYTDFLDVYYTADTANPSWIYVTTASPTVSGAQVLSATYTLPTSSLQAVRAQFRYQGSAASPCSSGSYDDHDDLAFAVDVSTASASARFIQLDSATQGNWKTAYGEDGFSINSDSVVYPRYAKVLVSNSADYVWSPSTLDPRALQKETGPDRIASAWYASSSFAIDLNLTDGISHEVALYVLDWDYMRSKTGASEERVEVYDAASQKLLDSRSLSDFTQGQYLVWTFQGHLMLKVINQGGTNAVVSGLFFGGGASPGQPSNDTVWVEDALPAGANPVVDDDTWTWIANPHFSGNLAHVSTGTPGAHQHYFLGAAQTLTVNAGDTLFTYIYLDPANLPSEVMLQWNDGTWEHRAYWGANLIPYGTDQTVSRTFMGPLNAIPVGVWFRLAVPAGAVGLEGRTLNGMAFTLYDGKATWDYAGKTASTLPAPGFAPPAQLSSDNTLSASYDPAIPVKSFEWSLSVQVPASGNLVTTPSPAGPQTIQSLTPAAGSAGTLPLNSLHPISGTYQISVRALTLDGRISPAATAQVSMVNAGLVTGLANVRVYPNPWQAKKTITPGITFDRFTTATTVKIFTVSGHWVKTLPSNGTSAAWDLTNDSGDKVASGIYLYLLSTDTGEKKTGQLVVIR